MAFRFQRRVTLIPGVRLNFGKTGVSLSAGIRGASITAGKRGVYGNVGAPGTGMSYRTRLDNAPAHKRRVQRSQQRMAGSHTISQNSVSSPARRHLNLKCDERGKLSMYHDDGTPATPALMRQVWESHASDVRAFLASELERINDDQALLLEIHHDTPAHNTLPPRFEKQPFDIALPHVPDLPQLPEEPRANPKRWWHSLFPFMERRRVARHEAEHIRWQQAFARISNERDTQEKTYHQQYRAWEQAKQQHDSIQNALANAFDEDLRNDPDFMAQVLEHELAQLDWPRETHVDFEIERSLLKLDVDLPTADKFPSREARLNHAGKRLLVKDKSATQQRKEYAAHVHGVVFRLIGVAFATLPAIHSVQVAAYTQKIDNATGHAVDEYLLQVSLSRDDWLSLNLEQPERIDPIAALEQFDLYREMTKTGILKALALEGA